VGKIAEKAVRRSVFQRTPSDCFFGDFAHWEVLTTSEVINDRWVEHFSDLLNIATETDQVFLVSLITSNQNTLHQPITEKEFSQRFLCIVQNPFLVIFPIQI